jgi:UDP-N-acetyl-D-mannosaminuronic acid dehydrogenase
MSQLNVAVIGLWYVGLPLAAVLANTDGFEVTGIQRRSARSGWKIDAINRGEAPVNGIEPELGRMVVEARAYHGVVLDGYALELL